MESTGISFLSVVRIGLQVLAREAQSDTPHPCIYLSKTVEHDTHSAGPGVKASDPGSACPACCPIKNGLAKRHLAAHSGGMNDPALNPPLIVQVPRPSSRVTLPGPIAIDKDLDELLEEDETHEQTVAQQDETHETHETHETPPPARKVVVHVVTHDLQPVRHAAPLERISTGPAAARPVQVPAPYPVTRSQPVMTAAQLMALDQELFARLKKERTRARV